MNIILFTEDEIRDDLVVLNDHRAVHIQKVLRAGIGDRIRIGVINGMRGHGVITAIEQGRPAVVRVAVRLDEQPCFPAEIDIILAMPRPIMLKRILSQVAALGIGTLFLIHANRVEKSFWESSLCEERNYCEQLRHGLEQAVDTRMPRVQVFRKFRPFIDDFLPEIIDDYRFKILAHPYGRATLAECLSAEAGRVLLAIGPEGGWVDFEVDRFMSRGFCCCSIGDRILKVDTAVIALHARISAIRELLRYGSLN